MLVENLKSFLAIVIFFTFAHVGFCNPADSLVVKLAFKSKEIKQADDLRMTLTIKSCLKQTVYLPGIDLWGLPSSVDGFYIIQVQKRSEGKYNNLHIRGALDNIPSLDTEKLHLGEEKELAFPLSMLYQYSKGEYRVRVLCKFSMLNKIRDQYSNWAYFSCDNDIRL